MNNNESRVSIQLIGKSVPSSKNNNNNNVFNEGVADYSTTNDESKSEESNKRKIDQVIPCKGNHLNVKHLKLDNHQHQHHYKDDINTEFIPTKPVEGFGAAMLRGMGWKDGKPFGRSKELVEPVEPKPRPYLAGLGSSLQQQIELDPKNRKLKEQLEKKVVVPDKKTSQIQSSLERGKSKDHPASSSSTSSSVSGSSSGGSSSSKKKKAITWLLPNLYVRFISEGKHYLQKGLIMDIPTKYECTIKMDSGGEILEHVGEDSLETIIPKQIGVQCMVVKGNQKGFVGNLVSKDREKETCLLKNQDDDVVVVSFDNCCEYRDF